MRPVGALILHLSRIIVSLESDGLGFLRLALRSRTALAAENLFLPKQLVLYRERQFKQRRANDAARLGLVLLVYSCAWKEALVVATPEILIR